MSEAFLELGLSPELAQAVAELGYETATPIQIAAIPLLLAGNDVIGQAQTGTGKTAAFALPILQNLKPGADGVQALVVAPTRELALQVTEAIRSFRGDKSVQVLTVYGGQSYELQIRKLKRGVDIVVGTPGRMLDLIQRGKLDLSAVSSVVLDEADEMLSLGFIEDIEAILAVTPESRQTALFSATIPSEIRNLANRHMHKPRFVSIESEHRTVETVDQRCYLSLESDKLAVLTRLFEVEEIASALIFTRTRETSGALANELTVRGFTAEALNGDLSQDARERVMGRFQDGRIKVLVATDIAARGLDIDHISHVFNFDLPQYPDSYVHRIGRTGRAGRAGVAITLVTPNEIWRLRKIETFTRQPITRCEVPTVEEIQAQRSEQLWDRMLVWLKRDRCNQEKEMVAKFVELGYDSVEIAAAAIKLARDDEKQRPIEPVQDVRDRQSRPDSRYDRPGRQNGRQERRNGRQDRAPRGGRGDSRTSHEADMVRLTFDAGRAHGVRPGDVVGAIAGHADIPGRTIGAIRIQENHTLVDVQQQVVSQVLGQSQPYYIRNKAVSLQIA